MLIASAISRSDAPAKWSRRTAWWYSALASAVWYWRSAHLALDEVTETKLGRAGWAAAFPAEPGTWRGVQDGGLAGALYLRQLGCWREERPRCRPLRSDLRRRQHCRRSSRRRVRVWVRRRGVDLGRVVVNEDDLLAGQRFELRDELALLDFRVDA